LRKGRRDFYGCGAPATAASTRWIQGLMERFRGRDVSRRSSTSWSVGKPRATSRTEEGRIRSRNKEVSIMPLFCSRTKKESPERCRPARWRNNVATRERFWNHRKEDEDTTGTRWRIVPGESAAHMAISFPAEWGRRSAGGKREREVSKIKIHIKRRSRSQVSGLRKNACAKFCYKSRSLYMTPPCY